MIQSCLSISANILAQKHEASKKSKHHGENEQEKDYRRL